MLRVTRHAPQIACHLLRATCPMACIARHALLVTHGSLQASPQIAYHSLHVTLCTSRFARHSRLAPSISRGRCSVWGGILLQKARCLPYRVRCAQDRSRRAHGPCTRAFPDSAPYGTMSRKPAPAPCGSRKLGLTPLPAHFARICKHKHKHTHGPSHAVPVLIPMSQATPLACLVCHSLAKRRQRSHPHSHRLRVCSDSITLTPGFHLHAPTTPARAHHSWFPPARAPL